MEYEKKYAPFFVNKICPKKSTNPILLVFTCESPIVIKHKEEVAISQSPSSNLQPNYLYKMEEKDIASCFKSNSDAQNIYNYEFIYMNEIKYDSG